MSLQPTVEGVARQLRRAGKSEAYIHSYLRGWSMVNNRKEDPNNVKNEKSSNRT